METANMEKIIREGEFKSYYVVWKLKNILLNNNINGSLNRTM